MINLNIKGSQIFQKSRGNIKILGARKVTKFHTEDPLSGATIQKFSCMGNQEPRICAPLRCQTSLT